MNHQVQYSSIMNAVPDGIGRPKKKRKLNGRSATIFLAVEFVVFMTLGAFLQASGGMAGLALSQLLLLGLSVGFVLLMGADFRTVFPVRKPKKISLLGVFLLWCGAICLSEVVSILVLLLAPQSVDQVSGLTDMFSSAPFLIQFLVIAIMPAICEEALYRGALQHGYAGSVRNKKALCLLIAAIFALSHLYPVKYAPIMILGTVMSYVVCRSENLVYSSFIHLLQNSFSLIVTSITGGVLLIPGLFVPGSSALFFMEQTAAAPDISAATCGLVMIMYGTPAPFLLYLGNYLFRRGEDPVTPRFAPEGIRTGALIRMLIWTAVFLAGGVLFVSLGL